MTNERKNSRAFSNVKLYPIIYKVNKCAWVTTQLFKEWFDNHFVLQARSHCFSVELLENCKILLLIDNCSVHLKEEVLCKENFIVCSLPLTART